MGAACGSPGVESGREETRARSGYWAGAVRGTDERGLALAQLCPLRSSVGPPPLGRRAHHLGRHPDVMPGAVVLLRGVDLRAEAATV